MSQKILLFYLGVIIIFLFFKIEKKYAQMTLSNLDIICIQLEIRDNSNFHIKYKNSYIKKFEFILYS